MKKIFTTVLLLMVTLQLFAQGQENAAVEMMQSSGKIYVVVTCAAIILIGLLLFMFTIDNRLKKLEKKSQDKN